MNSVDSAILDLVFAKVHTRAKSRAGSLRKEARGYWHTNRPRCLELKARAAMFDLVAQMIDEMVNDLLAYPASKEEV